MGGFEQPKPLPTGLLFLLEQAPRPIARDGQDEPVVRTERDPCHGEGVAFERPSERSELFRIVDPNYGVLRSRGLASRREQLARRGDADGDGLGEKIIVDVIWRATAGRSSIGDSKTHPPRNRGRTLFRPLAITWWKAARPRTVFARPRSIRGELGNIPMRMIGAKYRVRKAGADRRS